MSNRDRLRDIFRDGGGGVAADGWKTLVESVALEEESRETRAAVKAIVQGEQTEGFAAPAKINLVTNKETWHLAANGDEVLTLDVDDFDLVDKRVHVAATLAAPARRGSLAIPVDGDILAVLPSAEPQKLAKAKANGIASLKLDVNRLSWKLLQT